MDAPLKKRPSRAVFSEKENAKLREALEGLVALYGSQSSVAVRLSITQPTVSAFISGRQGASIGLARAIAREKGVRLYELLGWESEDAIAEPAYPTRDMVVQHAVSMGFTRDAIDELAAHAPPLDRGEPDKLYYLRLLCLIEERLAHR